MKFNEIITLLNEFDYRKNGTESTEEFLSYMLEEVARLNYRKNLKKLKKLKLPKNLFRNMYNVDKNGNITNYKNEEI